MRLVQVLIVKTCIICSWPIYDILLPLLPSFCQHDAGTVLPQPAGEAVLFGWDWICQHALGVWLTYWWKFHLWSWILQGEMSELLLLIFKKWYWLSRWVWRVDPESHCTQFAHKQLFPTYTWCLCKRCPLGASLREMVLHWAKQTDSLHFSRGRGWNAKG